MTQADSVHSTPPTNTSANNPPDGPQRPQDSLYRRTDISPEDFFQALGRVRRTVRDEIERLIEWLDSTIDTDQDEAVDDRGCDGDPDVEASLGSFDRMSNQIKAWATTTGYGSSYDVDCELDRCDDEESDPAEYDDTGIGDADGLKEQIGCRLDGLHTTSGEVL